MSKEIVKSGFSPPSGLVPALLFSLLLWWIILQYPMHVLLLSGFFISVWRIASSGLKSTSWSSTEKYITNRYR